jgi:hypothetical protein
MTTCTKAYAPAATMSQGWVRSPSASRALTLPLR